MARKLAIIDGNVHTGYCRTNGNGARHIIATTSGKSPPRLIKLSREIVTGCRRSCRRSLAFSHHDEIVGRLVVIYATGDHGGLYAAYEGVAEKVAGEGPRQYAVVATRQIKQGEWRTIWEKHRPPQRRQG